MLLLPHNKNILGNLWKSSYFFFYWLALFTFCQHVEMIFFWMLIFFDISSYGTIKCHFCSFIVFFYSCHDLIQIIFTQTFWIFSENIFSIHIHHMYVCKLLYHNFKVKLKTWKSNENCFMTKKFIYLNSFDIPNMSYSIYLTKFCYQKNML